MNPKPAALVDSPALRAQRLAAYRAGKYRFSAPPVTTARWDDESWMNWVTFDDPALTGFLPYTHGKPTYPIGQR